MDACVEGRLGAFGAFTLCPETNRLVQGRNVQDPVRVYVESDLNLRQVTRRWRDPIDIDLPRRNVVLSHRTLPCKVLDENTLLLSA